MAEGAGQPAGIPQARGLGGDSHDFWGGLVVVAIALLWPLAGYLTGPGTAFYSSIASLRFAPALDTAHAIEIAKYSLPLIVFAIPAFLSLIRNPQDYWGGAALVAFSMFSLWAASDLPGMRGFAFGPGTAPRMFGWLLVATGAAVSVGALLTQGPPLERWGIRAPILFIAAIIFFGWSVRPLGLVISAFVTLMIAQAASKEVRWVEATIWAAALTAFCVGLFYYGLNLPLQLWPR
jgi:putative tricarboxylic transport membrane protein